MSGIKIFASLVITTTLTACCFERGVPNTPYSGWRYYYTRDMGLVEFVYRDGYSIKLPRAYVNYVSGYENDECKLPDRG